MASVLPSDNATAVGRLAAWAASRAKDFEYVAQVRDADSPVADRALEIVKKFIIARGLILYGGQAIDCALRLKGSRVYPDHQTPDFDFYSPRSVDDAFALADLLVAAGFANVGAIPAIHVQTMRVKTDFIFVADISYTPRDVFDSLPTVNFAGMRVLHPDYQRTDMHLAFCFPFNTPPREDVFHRFAKDLKRFRLFQEFYPVTSGEALSSIVPGELDKNTTTSADDDDDVRGGASPAKSLTAVEVDLSRVAIHGFAAYGVFRATFCFLAAAALEAGVSKKVLAAARALAARTPALAVSFEAGAAGRHRVTFDPPAIAPRLLLATPWPDEVAAGIAADRDGASVEWYAPYMDSRPLMARVGGGPGPDVDVHSTRGRLLAVSVVDAPGAGAATPVQVTLVSPQYLLLNLLYEAHVSSGGARELYVEYYVATLRLLEAADILIAALRAEGGGPKVSEATFRAFVGSSPFGLAVRPLGTENHDASYLIRLSCSARNVGDTPPGLDPASLPNLANVPPKYFPGRGRDGAGKQHPSFDYEANLDFQRAGGLIRAPGAPPSVGGLEGGAPRAVGRGGTRTYLGLFEELDGAMLDATLRGAPGPRWVKKSAAAAAADGFVDLVAVDGKYNWDRRLWSFRCGMKSRLLARILTNKVDLHVRLSALMPSAIPATVLVPAAGLAPPTVPGLGADAPWIWRPGGGGGGRGVCVFSSQAALAAHATAFAAREPKKRAILSRYLTDPATVTVGGEARKLHLRLYYIVVVEPRGKRAALFREGRIAHARKAYAPGSYADAEVHDTHFGWSEDRRFPADYPGDAADVSRQALEILKRVSALAAPEVEAYGECSGGYEVFGVDFMVDAAGRVWLIEVNFKPGYGLAGESSSGGLAGEGSGYCRWVSGVIFGGVAEFALDYRGPDAEYARVLPCYEALAGPGP
jgi:hypothetical protein